MVFIPQISNYRPFYLQTSSDEFAIDTAVWGLIAKSNPYPALPSPKSVYNNDWKDEDGDDEYVESIHYSAVNFSVSFYVKAFAGDGKTAEEIMLSQINSFFDKIKQGEFKTYDSYTGIGFRKVRYVSYREENFKAGKNWARSIFTIEFKANDPMARMTLGIDGTITEA